MMDLNKHIYTNDDSKPFHSSGFAKAANADQLGATSSVSFNQRQQIETSRQLVGSYQRSSIGGTYNVMRPKPAVRVPVNRFKMPQRQTHQTLQQHNSLASAPRHFSEPQTRSYNPYG